MFLHSIDEKTRGSAAKQQRWGMDPSRATSEPMPLTLHTRYTCTQMNFLAIIVWWQFPMIKPITTIIVRDRPIFTSVSKHPASEITNSRSSEVKCEILQLLIIVKKLCHLHVLFKTDGIHETDHFTTFNSCEVYSHLLGQRFFYTLITWMLK